MADARVIFDGGLDLVTAKTDAVPGTLSDCYNFEVGRARGYGLIQGTMRFHGGAYATDYTLIRLRDGDWASTPSVGDTIRIEVNGVQSENGYIASADGLSVVGYGQQRFIYAIFRSQADLPTYSVVRVYDATIGAYIGANWYIERARDARGNQSDYNELIRTVIDADRDEVTGVPGRIGATVIGCHGFGGSLYAVRDYQPVVFTVTAFTDKTLVPMNGKWVFHSNTAAYAQIVEAIIDKGDWFSALSTGHLTLHNQIYDHANCVGFPNFNTSAFFTATLDPHLTGGAPLGTSMGGDMTEATSTAWSTNEGIALYVAQHVEDFLMGGGAMGVGLGSLLNPNDLDQFGTLQAEATRTSTNTSAGMYRARKERGWVEVDMLREIRFRAGTTALQSLVTYQRNGFTSTTTGDDTGTAVTYQNSGVKYGNAASNYVSATAQWVNPGNVNADDGSNATITLGASTVSGAYLWVRGNDFNAIPDSATITGIKVEIERNVSLVTGASFVQDRSVYITGVGSRRSLAFPDTTQSVQNKGNIYTNWTTDPMGTGNSVKVYGAENDLWGEPNISVAQLKSGSFGVEIVTYLETPGGGAITANIDYVRVTAYWINPTSVAYARNEEAASPVGIPMTVLRVHKTAGSYTATTAEGVLTVICKVDALKSRLVADGDKIRATDSGGGALYCDAAGSDYPVTLPSQAEMNAEESRWVWYDANFYADDALEAMYGANGAGRAVSYDGRTFYRIHTELLPKLDKPRHVTRHGAHLALAYRSGLALFSAIAAAGPDPLDFTSDDGAVAEEFGDRITGLKAMTADTLGVFCEKRIVALRGITASAFQQQTISPNIGAIEYMTVDIGQPHTLDNFGVSTVGVTDRFGDFLAGRLSYNVSPWLLPRVQADERNADLRPVIALAARNKNQVRYYFGDGYILTMTLVGAEQEAQFTTQRYALNALPWNTGELVKLPPYAGTSDVWPDGRERIFYTVDQEWAIAGDPTLCTAEKYGRHVYAIDSGWRMDNPNAGTGDTYPIQAYITVNPLAPDSKLKRFDRVFVHGLAHGYAKLRVSREKDYDSPSFPNVNVLDRTLGRTSDSVSLDQAPKRAKFDFPIEGYDVSWRFDSNTNATEDSEGPFTLQSAITYADSRGNSRGNIRN